MCAASKPEGEAVDEGETTSAAEEEGDIASGAGVEEGDTASTGVEEGDKASEDGELIRAGRELFPTSIERLTDDAAGA